MTTKSIHNLLFVGILLGGLLIPFLVGCIPTILNLPSNIFLAFAGRWLVGTMILLGGGLAGVLLFAIFGMPLSNLYHWCGEQASKLIQLSIIVQKRTKYHESNDDDPDDFDLTALRSDD